MAWQESAPSKISFAHLKALAAERAGHLDAVAPWSEPGLDGSGERVRWGPEKWGIARKSVAEPWSGEKITKDGLIFL